MQLIIKGKQMEVSPRLRQHIERKVQRFSRLLQEDSRVEVTVLEEQTRSARDHFTVQIAVTTIAHPIHSEASAATVNAALDLVIDKVSTQLERHKDRRATRKHATPPLKTLALSRSGALTPLEEEAYPKQAQHEEDTIDEEQNEQIWSRIQEIRRIATRHMTDQEVVAEMEKHRLDFYPFFNEESGSVNVMYRLEGGGFGLLIPAMEEASR